MRYRLQLSLLLIPALAALGGSRVFAQAAPGPSVPDSAVASSPSPVPVTTAEPDSAENQAKQDAAVKLNPFEVVENTNGYFAANTTAGTRLNSRVEDLGAAISVVTKQQMQDFGLLDINDIFNYEVNTVGTGNYTDYSFNASGMPVDNVQLNPQGANRIRGLAPANTTAGNFETSGRVPIDPLDIESVEISRGPNASLFGIGSPAGTVNNVPALANLSRDYASTTDRVDSFGGYRFSLDVNKVILKDKLAVRFSAVNQYDGFERKPSGVNTRRYNGEFQYRPLSKTTISGYFHFYESYGDRPNFTMPRDAITPWQSVGSPTWNPVTQTEYINGKAAGTYPSATASAPYLSTFTTGSMFFQDYNGSSLFTAVEGTDMNDPTKPDQAVRFMQASADPTGYLTSQPLFQKTGVVSSKAEYDYSSVNLAAANYDEDIDRTASVVIDQSIIDTPEQSLAAQAGFYLENDERFTNNPYGASSPAQGFVDTISLDVNQTLLNGAPNPYYLRPFVLLNSPNVQSLPLHETDYRVQLAYILDLTKKQGWLKWLGKHQLVGYGEYTDTKTYTFNYYLGILDNHAWLNSSYARGNETTAGGLAGAPAIVVPGWRYYLGGPIGSGNSIIDHSPKAFQPGAYPLVWGNALTGLNSESSYLGLAPDGSGSGGMYNTWDIDKARGAVLQSTLLNGMLIGTVGTRMDEAFSQNGATPFFDTPTTLDKKSVYAWSGAWSEDQGPTKTIGGVFRPVPWFQIFANKSDSFQPAPVAYGMAHELLPDPTGIGHDIGFGLHLFGGKLILRVDRYMTESIDTRDGTSTTAAQRAYRIDYASATGMVWNLERLADQWAQLASPNVILSTTQLQQAAAAIMKVPVSFLQNEYRAQAVDDVKSIGTELELNYTPVHFWTIKFNGSQTQAKNSGVAAEVTDYINARLPIWQSIVDPTTGLNWWTSSYSGQRPVDYFTSSVSGPLGLAQALAGKALPQIAEYRFNFLTNFRLSGITENWLLRRFAVGGAYRWQDKNAIGFYGVQQAPAIITDLDSNRPVWEKGQDYVDAFITYRQRIFADKMGMTIQLNGRNLNHNGGLLPISAQPDGTIDGYRIVDPRTFLLTVSFTF